MKCYIWILLVVLLLGLPAQASMTYSASDILKNSLYVTANDQYLNPLYRWANEVEGRLEGTDEFEAIRILESTGATYYTKLQAGDQSANLTLTLPTAYAGVNGYVLSSTTGGVLSWVANAGTFAGGTITSDITMTNGEYIRPDTTTAHTLGLQVYDVDNTTWRDALLLTNGDTAGIVLGTDGQTTFELYSTGVDIAYTGAISGVTTLNASGAITATGGVVLQNGATLTNAVDSEITLTDTSEDLTFDMDSASNVVGLKSSTGINGLALGDVDDLSGVGGITFDAAAATITTATSDAAQDLTLSVTGATNSSLVLASSGTAADALTISTSAGGMDITVAGAAAAEDLDIASNTSITIKSSEASQDDSIVIEALGANSGIDITSLGDIDITTTGAAGEDIQITNTGGSIMITATEAVSDAIKIAATGTVASATAMDLTTTDGGITIAASGAANGDLALSGADDASLTATDDLTLNGGSAGSIIRLGTNTQGNVIHVGDDDTTADTITIGSAKDTTAVAGISTTIGSTGTTSATTVQSGTGDLALTSTDDITMTVNTAVTDNITMTNTPGTAADAIKITATAGGIDIDAAAGKIIDIDGGTIQIDSKTAGAGAIAVTANQGAADTITVTNTQGTDPAAINLTATAGGITAAVASGKAITLNGTTNMKVGSNVASPAGGELDIGDGNYFYITGTNNITSIAAADSTAGRLLMLRFADVLTFTDGNNLKLAGNMSTTADDTITMMCDGTNWYEISRSAN